jgi:hypothetical protein
LLAKPFIVVPAAHNPWVLILFPQNFLKYSRPLPTTRGTFSFLQKLAGNEFIQHKEEAT